MAHLRKDELEFLIKLENELGAEENWSDRVYKLWEIIERNIKADKEKSEQFYETIKEKRKTSKYYARGKNYYLDCVKIDTAINRARTMLIDKAKENGIYENFGQEEVRNIRDKFIDLSDYSNKMNDNRNKLDAFDKWCMNYMNE